MSSEKSLERLQKESHDQEAEQRYFLKRSWNLKAPTLSPLGDHDVPHVSNKLEGKSIALMVCGGIAAMKAPLLARDLRKAGAKVTIFVSQEALRYVTLDTLTWSSNQPVITHLSARAEHLGDGQHFDAYLVAPASYNTINKFAYGIADGLITTTLSSALGKSEQGLCKILIAPTMHGTMHNQILTESLVKLRTLGVDLIKPREGYGKHNIPSEQTLVNEIARSISHSALKGRGILITGGPTPVRIDGIRRLSNKFTGSLAIKILDDLHARGAEARLLLGRGSLTPPDELKPFVEWVDDYEDYLARVKELTALPQCWAGIFTAAVADYQPREIAQGKIESGQEDFHLSLVPTLKVIDEVRTQNQDLKMITFKYQEGVSHDELMKIANNRLKRFDAVFANRGEDIGPKGEQVGWLCYHYHKLLSPQIRRQKFVGKTKIAEGIGDILEMLAQS